MMIHILFLSLFFSSLLFTNISSAAKQKMLFNVESISYRRDSAYSCQRDCATKYNDPPLEKMLNEGWRIVSSSPKEAIGEDDYVNSNFAHGCTCKGTQYVLQKDDPDPVTKTAVPSQNEELLKKENDLLKRENDLLKQENETLKEKLKQKQRKK